MTAAEVIEELRKHPPNALVEAWDGDYQYPVPVRSVTYEDGAVQLWSEPPRPRSFNED